MCYIGKQANMPVGYEKTSETRTTVVDHMYKEDRRKGNESMGWGTNHKARCKVTVILVQCGNRNAGNLKKWNDNPYLELLSEGSK